MHCYAKGYCFENNGWQYLHIEGDPYERGFQHGYLLARQMAQAIKAIKYYIYFTTGKKFHYFAANADRMFTSVLKKTEFEDELIGIIDGARKAGFSIEFEELVAWNGFLELIDCWWPWKQQHSLAERIAINKCSAFIATGDATKEKTIIMAHNTWYSFMYAQNFYIIADIQSSNGFRILMQTMPGYITSMSDFFVTSGGLAGTETTIQLKDYKEEGKPLFLRSREAMQYAGTINEWVNIIKQGNNGGVANSWLLGDLKTNEIACFELGLEYEHLTKITNGIFAGYNAPEDPRIRNLEYSQSNYYYDIRSEIGARRVRFSQLAQQYYGKIDEDSAKEIISDHFDVYLNAYNPCTRTICCHSDNDPGEYPTTPSPYSLYGSLDGKVLGATLGNKMQFEARWGRPCGTPFHAAQYLEEHPQWDWQRGYLSDMPTQPWTLFGVGM